MTINVMRGALAALILGVLARPALADPECHPVAPDAIAKAWNDFASRRGVQPNGGGDRYECVTLDRSRTTACRTTAANPAHPSIVIRTVVRRQGGWFVDTEAETAAACEPFLAMLREFDALTSEMRDALARQHQDQPAD